ncbi:MAG TPA: alkaline phosphatase D family protein [Pyrinomonadaceae bacterium]|nr:alkaline phosphatase D family protein [Pyrinomonadaceae bacterium]
MTSRREFIKRAAACGAVLAWGRGVASASSTGWQERRDLFPHGVASGDPDPKSVILWTRRPPGDKPAAKLVVEIAEDEAFRRVIGKQEAMVSANTDWTCRVLAAGLKPRTIYWYRFTDEHGFGSRVGRTITAPADKDASPVNFTFVSCQSVNEGKLNGYRRMIFEDERARPEDQLGFVLHLGDFIYEVVQYPEEGKKRYDRTIYEVCRIPDAGKTGNLYWPKTVDGYRAVWKGYLADPDLQDARARWPFVCMWDNHEFSWQGRQSILQQGGPPQPGQAVKVAANQAWFEYIPARVTPPSGSLTEFGKVAVENVKIEEWDENGLGAEPNNLAAIRSLIAYRSLRYGKHLDLFVTDQRSFAGEDPSNVEDVGKIFDPAFRGYFSEEAMIALDAGKAHDNGKPPAELQFRDVKIPNPSKNKQPRTILGVEQKAWFKTELRKSKATWKIWGNSLGALDNRVDMQNLPAGMVKNPWPADTYGIGRTDDWGAAYAERTEIYDLVRDAKITGFAIVSGDRHAFWAGYAAANLPPRKFEPVGLSFVGGSLISPGGMEALEHGLRKDHPLRALFLADRPNGAKPAWTYNMLLRHGVRSAIEYAKSFNLKRAKELSNPQLAPHLEFIDLGGHGYAKVSLSSNEMRTEFVCIPRPITRSERPDGGPLRYRVSLTSKLWKPGERPHLEVKVLEGDVELSI